MIARRGQVVDLQTYGRRDIEAGDQMEEDAIFRIYSARRVLSRQGTLADMIDKLAELPLRHQLVVIPAGVFYGWDRVEDQITYLSIRPYPDKVLPEGYVNPYAE